MQIVSGLQGPTAYRFWILTLPLPQKEACPDAPGTRVPAGVFVCVPPAPVCGKGYPQCRGHQLCPFSPVTIKRVTFTKKPRFTLRLARDRKLSSLLFPVQRVGLPAGTRGTLASWHVSRIPLP